MYAQEYRIRGVVLVEAAQPPQEIASSRQVLDGGPVWSKEAAPPMASAVPGTKPGETFFGCLLLQLQTVNTLNSETSPFGKPVRQELQYEDRISYDMNLY